MTTRNARVPTVCTGNGDAGDFDRNQLLAEVDLKWLFAGQGRWIDMAQLNDDPLYASKILKTAIDSTVEPLHTVAMAMSGLVVEHYW